jgi:mRNA interferase RelE/StbE
MCHADKTKRVRSKTEQYVNNPVSQACNVKALVSVDESRLRIRTSPLRVDETAVAITILDIGPRGGIDD